MTAFARFGALTVLAAAALCVPAVPVAAPPPPLPVDEAFALRASWIDGSVQLRVEVAPGHYLYADRFEATWAGKPWPALQRSLTAGGKPKQDPHFGLVRVYDAPVEAKARVAPADAQSPAAFSIVFQGCSEVAGICYPPAERKFALTAGGRDQLPSNRETQSLKDLFRKQVSQ
ncbi:MAG: protein-disulfide reductase DsbD N-terminal domain-containing protein [Burkholderiales bacterium]|nr:protein-disulfide reductase DsbD N-terminal domain-containing protein [Burkholderiales bacterium]